MERSFSEEKSLPSQPDRERSSIRSAVRAIQKKVRKFPKVGVVLGSGLGNVLNGKGTSLRYNNIPHFPKSRVEGHAGVLHVGKVAVLRGRSHYYEGHSMQEIVRPVRVLAELGVETIVLTNAAGTVNSKFRPGELMMIEDHLNFMGGNPLRGENLEELGPRFPDMSDTYDPQLRKIAAQVARAEKIKLRKGVYVALAGPSYETPAEIRAYRRLGADVVGMSTVPEVIAARHAGMKVLAFSCITNMAAGLSQTPLSHEEVIETTNATSGDLARFLEALLEKIV